MFRELSRKNKQIPVEECIAILENEKRGVLSVNGDDGYPYGMPMNHWYDKESGKIYFHCGFGGHRLDSIAKNAKVSFCVHDEGYVKDGEWALNIRSVVVFGKIKVIDDYDTIVSVSQKLSRKFTDDEKYIEKEIKAFASQTLILELTLEHICGKAVTES